MHEITTGICSNWRHALILLLLPPAVIFGVDAAPAEQVASTPESAGPLILDDVPEPFRPTHPRTPEERDRVDAIALFAAGLALERKERYAEALQNYQRALRLGLGLGLGMRR